jgi:ABC-type multidrug transport system ATPase subunit
MDEAGLCDRVALIQKGEILSINTPKGITGEFKKPLWAVKASEMFKLMNAIKDDPEVESCYPFGQYHHVTFKQPSNDKAKLEELTQSGHYTHVEIQSIEPNIEDCFMKLMKE